MDYGITTLAGVNRYFDQITETEFESIKTAKQRLLDCRSIEEKFDFVVESHLALEEGIIGVALISTTSSGKHDKHWYDRHLAMFNHRLAILLTAMKTYSDAVPKDMERMALSRREVNRAFNAARGRLGYRAMEALRNYAQHSDFPIRQASYGGHMVGHPPDHTVIRDVEPKLTPSAIRLQYLRNKRDQSVVEELQGLGEESIPLTRLTRDAVEGLWTVHCVVRRKTSPKIAEWKLVLVDARTGYLSNHPDLVESVAVAAVAREDDGNHAEEIHLVSRADSYRAYLEAKNDNLDGISSVCVTNESWHRVAPHPASASTAFPNAEQASAGAGGS